VQRNRPGAATATEPLRGERDGRLPVIELSAAPVISRASVRFVLMVRMADVVPGRAPSG
jgi:hypothetical protein